MPSTAASAHCSAHPARSPRVYRGWTKIRRSDTTEAVIGAVTSAAVATSPAAPPNTTAAATVAITYPRKVFGSPLFRLPTRAADGALLP
ncbi:hypothetical protein [Streptomyces sp. NPDC012746]|uniref:hypothetical protein n=1 Tax=Streptomyces sp. NPDC012746 TaxID=3364845 RepID=UPI0036831A23